MVDISNVFEGLYYFLNIYEEISYEGVIEIDDYITSGYRLLINYL